MHCDNVAITQMIAGLRHNVVSFVRSHINDTIYAKLINAVLISKPVCQRVATLGSVLALPPVVMPDVSSSRKARCTAKGSCSEGSAATLCSLTGPESFFWCSSARRQALKSAAREKDQGSRVEG